MDSQDLSPPSEIIDLNGFSEDQYQLTEPSVDHDKDALFINMTPAELHALPHKSLIQHCIHLQDTCLRLETEKKIFLWEVKDAHSHLTLASYLASIAHKLNVTDLDAISQVAVNDIPNFLGANFAALYLYEQDSFSLLHSTVKLKSNLTLSVSEECKHHLIFDSNKTNRSLLIEDFPNYSNSFIPPGEENLLSHFLGKEALLCPLIMKQRQPSPLLIGCLFIGGKSTPFSLSDAEFSFMFTELLSSSVYNSRLLRRLNELALTDGLTGLFNRRYFTSELEKNMSHSKRTKNPLSLCLLDIDFFKKVNDTYGHLAGDEVLKNLSATLQKETRKDIDVPARYGGEEFAVIMPYTITQNASLVADRIRKAVQSHTTKFESNDISVTCSIGVTEYRNGEDIASFLERVDSALYLAKSNGRNRIEVL